MVKRREEMNEDGPKITWVGVGAIATGISLFYLVKYKINPWVIETVCRELVRCG